MAFVAATYRFAGEPQLLPTLEPRQVAFASAGRFVAVGDGSAMQIWDVPARQLHFTITGPHPIRAFAVGPGTYIAGISDSDLTLWDISNGQKRWAAPLERAPRYSAFSPTGQFIAAAAGTEVIVWTVARGRETHRFGSAWRPGQRINSFAFSPDGQYVAIAAGVGWRAGVALIPIAYPAGQKTISRGVEISVVRFSPDGRLVIGIGHEGVRIWDAKIGAEIRSVPVGNVALGTDGALAVGTDGELIALASASSVQLWEARTGEKVRSLEADDCCIDYIAFSPAGGLVVTHHAGSFGYTNVRLWHSASGRLRRSIRNVNASLAFSSDGKKLAVGHWPPWSSPKRGLYLYPTWHRWPLPASW